MRTSRRARVAALVICCAGALAVPSLAAAATVGRAQATPASTVLVFFAPAGPPGSGRIAHDAVRAAQDDVVATDAVGADVIARTTVPDTMTLRLSSGEVSALSGDPRVALVVPEVVIPGPARPSSLAAPGSEPPAGAHVIRRVPCGTPAHPELDPEGLANIDAPGAWREGATGKGVTVAYLADGVDPSNHDLVRNAAYASGGSAAGTPVITTYQDFSGDGTAAPTGGAEAFGDAASIAAQGNVTYDLSRYVAKVHPLPRGCDIHVVGVAPGASLLALKIFSAHNATTASGFVQAIDYAVAHGAKVINESFGSNGFPDTAVDVVRYADDAAVAAGVTVVASTGDAGVTSTIGSPASDPNVIGVGATTTFRSYAQDTYGGINAPGSSGAYLDNNISSLSSGGIAQDGRTVTLVAPGDLGWSLCSAQKLQYAECDGMAIQDFGGTSEASPLVAGAAACVIQAYEATHHGAAPAPSLVMRILTSTARDVGAPADQQGAGLLDVAAAVRMARSIAGSVAPPDAGLLASTSQLSISGTPRTPEHSTITLTNESRARITVSLATRALVPAGAVAGSISLNPAVHTSQPKFTVWSGATEVYQRSSFRVPAGESRVKLNAAYLFHGQTSLLHVALFDPTGALAGYSLPQGPGSFADVEVAHPRPGAWRAVFFTVWNGYGSGNVGTSGPVRWSASFWRTASVGAVTPATLVLGPQHTASVTLHATLPASPGDGSLALLATSSGSSLAIPVVERTTIPITASGGHFSGLLTGGNGREGAPGQTNTYAFTVPGGKTDLDASVALARNPAGGEIPGDQVIAMLVDPTGQVAAADSNYSTDSDFFDTVTRFVNLYRARPAPGTWQLVLEWAQPGAGEATSIPFSGAVRFNQVTVQSTLPDDAASTISTSSGADFAVKVTNTGVAPMLVSPDARLTATVTMGLVDAFGDPVTQVFGAAEHVFYVPTETTSITASVAGSLPATFDASPYAGDPDLSPTMAVPGLTGSVTPSLATLTWAPSTGVSPGLWAVVPAELGPFGASAQPSGTETTTASALTRAFDPAMSSTVPDTVETLTTETGSISPDLIEPGSWDLLTIHVAPTASVGTVVSGTLFIDGLTTGDDFGDTIADEPLFTSDLAAIDYAYTVAS